MIVVVDGGSGRVAMDDSENLRDLRVQLRSCAVAQAQTLLGDLGRIDGEHVWLDIPLLKALSPLADDAEWARGFDGVMSYTRSKGWIDETGARVRAHVE